MGFALHTLHNDYWQLGVLPETGASIAFGRVRTGGGWADVLRPTAEADYSSASNCANFIMLPWCNRIRDGLLRFKGEQYQLRTAKDDGSARHGDVRARAWTVADTGSTHITLTFNSRDHADVNWPFAFAARAEYRLNGDECVWRLSLKNEDSRPMPGGFGYHPYFVRPQPAAPANGDGDDQTVLLQVHCDQQFELQDFLAVGGATPIKPHLDFRRLRPLDDRELNDVLTDRRGHMPTRILYPEQGIELKMFSDPMFEHILVFTPAGKPFFAVEPMSNVSDGFNLFEQGIPGSGVFILSPGEERGGVVILNSSAH